MSSPNVLHDPESDPPVFKFACSHCGQRISSEDDVTGQTVDCPACSQSFLVQRKPSQLELPKAEIDSLDPPDEPILPDSSRIPVKSDFEGSKGTQDRATAKVFLSAAFAQWAQNGKNIAVRSWRWFSGKVSGWAKASRTAARERVIPLASQGWLKVTKIAMQFWRWLSTNAPKWAKAVETNLTKVIKGAWVQSTKLEKILLDRLPEPIRNRLSKMPSTLRTAFGLAIAITLGLALITLGNRDHSKSEFDYSVSDEEDKDTEPSSEQRDAWKKELLKKLNIPDRIQRFKIHDIGLGDTLEHAKSKLEMQLKEENRSINYLLYESVLADGTVYKVEFHEGKVYSVFAVFGFRDMEELMVFFKKVKDKLGPTQNIKNERVQNLEGMFTNIKWKSENVGVVLTLSESGRYASLALADPAGLLAVKRLKSAQATKPVRKAKSASDFFGSIKSLERFLGPASAVSKIPPPVWQSAEFEVQFPDRSEPFNTFVKCIAQFPKGESENRYFIAHGDGRSPVDQFVVALGCFLGPDEEWGAFKNFGRMSVCVSSKSNILMMLTEAAPGTGSHTAIMMHLDTLFTFHDNLAVAFQLRK